MRDVTHRGPRATTTVVEDADAPACTPPADRGPESEGAGAGAKHRAQAPLMTALTPFAEDGCAPGIDGSARPAELPPAVAPEWWCLASGKPSVGEPPDHDAGQVGHDAPPHTPEQRGG